MRLNQAFEVIPFVAIITIIKGGHTLTKPLVTTKYHPLFTAWTLIRRVILVGLRANQSAWRSTEQIYTLIVWRVEQIDRRLQAVNGLDSASVI